MSTCCGSRGLENPFGTRLQPGKAFLGLPAGKSLPAPWPSASSQAEDEEQRLCLALSSLGERWREPSWRDAPMGSAVSSPRPPSWEPLGWRSPNLPAPWGARRERRAQVSLAAGGTAFLFPFLSGGVSSPDPHLHSAAGGGLGGLEASSTALCRHNEQLNFNIHSTRKPAEVPGLLVLFC